jgi:hypothetical protein
MKWTGSWVAVSLLCAWTSCAEASDPPAPDGARPYAGVSDGLRIAPAIVDDGGQHVDFAQTRHRQDPPDLTLWNFFTAGWDEEFTRRDSEGRAPNLALLRVQTNFMEREFRLNYADTSNQRSKTLMNLANLDYLIAYALDRRFMIEVLGNYQWEEARKGADSAGPSAQFVGRVQLISVADSSYSFNFRAISPDTGLGQHQTTLSYGLAGFEDLTRFGLYRCGLYTSVLFDSLTGPGAVGAKRNDVGYDVTFATTLTSPTTPLVGNLTLFLECFAQTDVDGSNAGHTVGSITPGVRFNLGTLPRVKLGIDNWLMFGVDVPVVGPKPWDAIYRFTYITNF